MTYCIGVMLDKGMIFASDSRTNAGLDNIAKFCKMTVFERAGDRVIVLLSSGNLAGTQAVIGVLNQRCAAGEPSDAAPSDSTISPGVTNLWNARTMFDVAMLVANAMRDIERRDGEYLQENEVGFNASFIVGGQIGNEPQRLFRIYAEGNFIEAGTRNVILSDRRNEIREASHRPRHHTFHSARRCDQMRAGVLRFHDALQSIGGDADRSHLLRVRQPASDDATTL